MAKTHAGVSIYTVGGAVQAGGGRYIPRRADEELLELCRAGDFAYVLTPRQLGKTSLMVRTAGLLVGEGVRPAVIDLTQIGVRVTEEEWYVGLLTALADQLMLETNAYEWWQARSDRGPTQRLMEFLRDVLLVEVVGRIVIFVDEIDTTLSLSFTDDFYAAIRYLYNARAHTPEFRRLSFVLFGVATPGDLVCDPSRTPFNIGQRVDLTDFTLDEALPLAEGLGLPPDESSRVLGWVLGWTGGHPYLTQRLCRAVAREGRRGWSEEEVQRVVADTFFGPQSEKDHNLQFVRDMLIKRAPDVASALDVYGAVVRGRQVRDEEQSLTKSHLKLSGIVYSDGGLLRVRNPIYREIFDESWVREHTPVNIDWKRRLTRAAMVLTGVVLFSLIPLSAYAFKQASDANAARREAVEQREIALRAREEADRQRAQALSAKEEAQAERARAVEQKERADESARLALEREAEAKRATVKVRAAERRVREVQLKAALEESKRVGQEAKTAKERAEVFQVGVMRMFFGFNGLAAFQRGDYTSALNDFENMLESIKRERESLGGDNSGLKTSEGWAWANVGAVHHQMGKPHEAIRYYERAIEILEKVPPPPENLIIEPRAKPILIDTYEGLARAYQDAERFGDAEKYYIRTRELMETDTIRDAARIIRILGDVARLYREMHLPDQAEEIYKGIIEFRRRAGDEPQLASALKEIAQFYSRQGRWVEAEESYRQVLALREKDLSDSRAWGDIAETYSQLGEVYSVRGEQGRSAGAFRLATRFQEMMLRSRLVSSFPHIMTLQFIDAGDSYVDLGGYRQAEVMYHTAVRAMAGRESATEIGRAYRKLSDLYKTYLTDYAKAEEFLKLEVEMYTKGPMDKDSPALPSALVALGQLYEEKLKRPSEAEAAFKRALDVVERGSNNAHEVVNILSNLAHFYERQNRSQDYERMYSLMLPRMGEIIDGNVPLPSGYSPQYIGDNYLSTIKTIADLHLERDEYAKAAAVLRLVFEKSDTILSLWLTPDAREAHVDMLERYSGLLRILRREREAMKVDELTERVRRGQRSSSVPPSPR